MSTIEETMELCRGGGGRYDPLYDVDTESHRIFAWDGWIYVQGYDDESGYASDLLVVVIADGWALFWRDPEDAKSSTFGRAWCGGHVWEKWGDLVSQAYSL